MKKLITICLVAELMFVISTPVANATLNYGNPSPSLSPLFGTLVNFDDKPIGTAVGQYDYVSLGVASIVETSKVGFFARYSGTQSQPCYVGTGPNAGWNGTIVIDLASPADKIGIGVADSQGGPETLSIYGAGGVLLESYILDSGLNIYPYITRSSFDISRIQISGEFFAIDDLQFTVPEPTTICLFGIGALSLIRRKK
jgi:hypothetical protein